ncbi:MAG: hypothetical protein WBP41_14195 [Saprospiraceae bacterium]
MKNIFILSLSFWIYNLAGQDLKTDTLRNGVNIIGVYADTHSIIVRWVPSSPSVWSYSKFYGYRLERCEIDTITGVKSKWTFPGDSIRKPISLEKWRILVSQNPDDVYLQAAGQAHHGERRETGETLSDLMKKSDEFKNYYAAAMLSSEFSASAANASALRFEDHDIVPGKLYIYRIRSLCPNSTLEIEEGITSVSTFKVETFPKIIMDHVYEGENVVEIAWDKEIYSRFYSAFNIYRSADKGNTWQKINKIPFAFTGIKNENLFFYRDSLKENYVPMQYQIEGITPYAITGPKSDIIEAMSRDRTPPIAPYNIETQYLGKGRMKVTWQADPNDKDIAGFRISRSNQANEGFLELTTEALGSGVRTYTDTTCNEMINNYYYVGVFDKEGNVNVGFPKYGTIIDSIPPAPPTGLEGNIDTNGVVTVKWNLGKEPDLKGYYVHSSNQKYQTFINLTGHPVQDTIWHDTIPLNVLTEQIYYKIVAVDMRSNYSGYSEMLTLKKPDRVPPVAPVFISVRNEKDAVKLQWYNSTSHDVKLNILERKSAKENAYQQVYSCQSNTEMGEYVDRNVDDGVIYQYRLHAQDDDNLYSEFSGLMKITAYVDKTVAPLEKVNAVVKNEEKKVELSWVYPHDQKVRFAVYRSLNGSPYQSHKIVEDSSGYEETGFKKGDVIRYKIKVINAKGWQSSFSKEVMATIATK